MPNLTQRFLEKLKAGDVRVTVYDSSTAGFAVRVEPAGGRMTFCWYRKIHGSPRFRSIGEVGTMTLADARAEADKLNAISSAWKAGRYQGPDPFQKERKLPVTRSTVPTFQELLDAYVRDHVRVKAPTSPEHAEKIERAAKVATWMASKYFPTWSNRAIDSITIDDLLTVKHALGAKHHSANRCVEYIKALFNWSNAAPDGKVNFWPVSNPAKQVALHDEAPRTVFLESDELARFNDALKNEPSADLRDFLILALATGARRGNILGMRWANIAWEREAWVVPFAKNGRSYEVQLTRPALTVLRRRRDLAAEDSTFVFPGIGATGHLINVNKLWHVFRTRAKLQHIRLHSLRHTAASYLAQSGASLQVIGAALGHASLGSTEVYSHLISQTVRDAREASERKMLESVKSAKARQKKALASRRARPALTA